MGVEEGRGACPCWRWWLLNMVVEKGGHPNIEEHGRLLVAIQEGSIPMWEGVYWWGGGGGRGGCLDMEKWEHPLVPLEE